MLYEYAVEPESLARLNVIWQALEQFGVPHGRLISRFPKTWLKEVYTATAGCSDNEKKALEVRLIRLRQMMISSKRDYHPQMTWRQNAHAQQMRRSFHAIIQRDNEENINSILTPFDCGTENPLWNVPAQEAVERTSAAIAAHVAPLVEISKRILFIDPYFSAKPKWTKVLLECLKPCVAAGANCRRIEIHTCENKRARPKGWKTSAGDELAKRLPLHFEVSLFSWREFDDGERFHARYVLTERGGIQVEGGLDAGEPGQTTNVSLLSENVYEMRWRQYQPDTAAFALVGELKIVGKLKMCSTNRT